MKYLDSACEWLGNHPTVSAALLIVGAVVFVANLVWAFVAKIDVEEEDAHARERFIG